MFLLFTYKSFLMTIIIVNLFFNFLQFLKQENFSGLNVIKVVKVKIVANNSQRFEISNLKNQHFLISIVLILRSRSGSYLWQQHLRLDLNYHTCGTKGWCRKLFLSHQSSISQKQAAKSLGFHSQLIFSKKNKNKSSTRFRLLMIILRSRNKIFSVSV